MKHIKITNKEKISELLNSKASCCWEQGLFDNGKKFQLMNDGKAIFYCEASLIDLITKQLKPTKPTIKFNKYNVTNGTIKARVYYSKSPRIDGREAVTLYAKDYDRNLGKIFADEYKNDTDTQSDYFETGRVVLFKDHPLYEEALKRV